MLAGVVRSLAPQILAAGIATEAELGLGTLPDRIARDGRVGGRRGAPADGRGRLGDGALTEDGAAGLGRRSGRRQLP